MATIAALMAMAVLVLRVCMSVFIFGVNWLADQATWGKW